MVGKIVRHIFVLILAWVAFTFAKTDTLQIQFDASAEPVAVGVWYPDKMSNKNVPVVYWFHGGMRSSNCQKGLEAGKGFFELAEKALVISVSACGERDFLNPTTLAAFDASLDSLKKRFSFLADTVSLVGVSDGALGVFVYSLYGKRFIKNRLLVSSYLPLFGTAREWQDNPKFFTGKWTFFQGARDRLYRAEETFPWILDFCSVKSIRCQYEFDNLGEHDWSYWVKNKRRQIFDFIKDL